MLCVLFQINKPYLPLASGEYSFGTGVAIVASFSILVPYRLLPFSMILVKTKCIDWVEGSLLFYFFSAEFLAWLDSRFMAIILGSFRKFCARDCLFNQCELFWIAFNLPFPPHIIKSIVKSHDMSQF